MQAKKEPAMRSLPPTTAHHKRADAAEEAGQEGVEGEGAHQLGVHKLQGWGNGDKQHRGTKQRQRKPGKRQ